MDPFEFYSQVYGIDSVIVAASATPTTDSVMTPSAPRPQPWILFTTSLTTVEFQKYSDMFSKITGAMGLQPTEFVLCLQDSNQQMPAGAQVSVTFGGTELGWHGTSELPKQLVVSSLQDMAQNPELKKSAWTLLKQVMEQVVALRLINHRID